MSAAEKIPPSVAASPVELPLDDGARVRVTPAAAEIVDAAGRLLVRYANGVAEIAAPAGDLVLRAPRGNVVLHAAGEVVLHAGDAAAPTVTVAADGTRVETPAITVDAKDARLVAERGAVLAGHVVTTARTIATHVERLELTAARVVERTQEAFREVAGLSQTRAGRVRTIVDDVLAVWSRRTTLTSTEDTSIDGSKVLLG